MFLVVYSNRNVTTRQVRELVVKECNLSAEVEESTEFRDFVKKNVEEYLTVFN